jgi:hypothetical protein
MKTSSFPAKIRLTVLSAAGILLATLPCAGLANGWFLPTKLPAGEYHRYWAIGLSTPKLEQYTGTRTLKDGTHVFAFKSPTESGHIYVWDRESHDYNSPAVASTDARFQNYTTMDRNNLTFVKNIYDQLRGMWGEGNTRAQRVMLQKLQEEIDRSGDRIF